MIILTKNIVERVLQQDAEFFIDIEWLSSQHRNVRALLEPKTSLAKLILLVKPVLDISSDALKEEVGQLMYEEFKISDLLFTSRPVLHKMESEEVVLEWIEAELSVHWADLSRLLKLRRVHELNEHATNLLKDINALHAVTQARLQRFDQRRFKRLQRALLQIDRVLVQFRHAMVIGFMPDLKDVGLTDLLYALKAIQPDQILRWSLPLDVLTQQWRFERIHAGWKMRHVHEKITRHLIEAHEDSLAQLNQDPVERDAWSNLAVQLENELLVKEVLRGFDLSPIVTPSGQFYHATDADGVIVFLSKRFERFSEVEIDQRCLMLLGNLNTALGNSHVLPLKSALRSVRLFVQNKLARTPSEKPERNAVQAITTPGDGVRKTFYNRKEAAAYLDVDARTIDRLKTAGHLKGSIPLGKRKVFLVDDLDYIIAHGLHRLHKAG